jgi:hypothetical protein
MPLERNAWVAIASDVRAVAATVSAQQDRKVGLNAHRQTAGGIA